MKYQHVYIDDFSYTLPEEVVTTAALEERLAPLYGRLSLPYGRLELMTGIKERRLWPAGELPGDASVRTVERLLTRTGIDRGSIGAFLHASVCRDYQEPATACDVHRRLHLPARCTLFDLSNACLGLLSGVLQVANMIELGQIEAGIVVGTESSRTLTETTVEMLNRDTSITRRNFKPNFASLTIGSGSAAILLTGERRTQTHNRLLGGIVHANSAGSALCRSAVDVSAGGRSEGQSMQTDSETLLHEGVATAQEAFELFLPEVGWSREEIDRIFCHQVGKAHQQLLFERLRLDSAKNFTTFSLLGNTGSVALPTAAAVGMDAGVVRPNEKVALLGIGSGINVVMLALDVQTVHKPAPSEKPILTRFLAEQRKRIENGKWKMEN